MHDEDSGSAQQGGWQPPEYVSPWLPASGSPEGGEGANDTISYRGGPAYDAGQGPADGPAVPGWPRLRPGLRPRRVRRGYGRPVPRAPAARLARLRRRARRPRLRRRPRRCRLRRPRGPGGPGRSRLRSARLRPEPVGRVRQPAAAACPVRLQPDAGLRGGRGARGRRRRRRRGRAQPQLKHPRRARPTGNSGTGNGGSGGTGTRRHRQRRRHRDQPVRRGRLRRLRVDGNGAGNGGTGGTNSGTGSLNATALSAKVDPGLVDVTSDLKYSGATAEGTGMVISSSGLVLTNNHVIDQSTSVSAAARDLRPDLHGQGHRLQLDRRRGAAAARRRVRPEDGQPLQLRPGQGRRGGARARQRRRPGGLPSTAQGTIQAPQPVDQGQRPGRQHDRGPARHARDRRADPGGRLRRPAGQRQRPGRRDGHRRQRQRGPGRRDTDATQGFAIPINKAISIANEINEGKASTTVHIGLSGFIGVNVANASTPADCGTDAGGTGVFTPASTRRAGLRRLPGRARGDGRPGRRRRDHLGQRHLGQHRQRPDQP